jgi:hypothetical protein
LYFIAAKKSLNNIGGGTAIDPTTPVPNRKINLSNDKGQVFRRTGAMLAGASVEIKGQVKHNG